MEQPQKLVCAGMLTCFDSRNAGFFLWVDLSACLETQTWEAEDGLKKALYDSGVEMASGRGYHDEKPGSFRLVSTIDKDSLVEALRRYACVRNSIYMTNAD